MNTSLLSLLLFVIMASLIYYKNIRKIRTKAKIKTLNLVGWMAMTRDERYALDLQDKKMSMKRKQILLKQIRKEYVSLNHRNNKKK